MFRKCDVYECEADAYKVVKVGENEYAYCNYHQPIAYRLSFDFTQAYLDLRKEWAEKMLSLDLKENGG